MNPVGALMQLITVTSQRVIHVKFSYLMFKVKINTFNETFSIHKANIRNCMH